jgi:hypothetical protein
MFFSLKKSLLLFTLMAALLSYGTAAFAEQTADTIMDDSIRDISLVVGAGAVGAVLGLSTLSFVDKPSEHMRNIAVGGALGIVVGVAVVIFSQATRSSLSNSKNLLEVPMNPEKYATLTRHEFSEEKIAKTQLSKNPSLGYSFSF